MWKVERYMAREVGEEREREERIMRRGGDGSQGILARVTDCRRHSGGRRTGEPQQTRCISSAEARRRASPGIPLCLKSADKPLRRHYGVGRGGYATHRRNVGHRMREGT